MMQVIAGDSSDPPIISLFTIFANFNALLMIDERSCQDALSTSYFYLPKIKPALHLQIYVENHCLSLRNRIQ